MNKGNGRVAFPLGRLDGLILGDWADRDFAEERMI